MSEGRPLTVFIILAAIFVPNISGINRTNSVEVAPGMACQENEIPGPSSPQEPEKKAGLEGTVVLGATIGELGQVTEVNVLESVPGLDQAAVEAVKQWLYSPVWIDGQPAIFTFTVTVRFSLK
jgi:TonB family protein